MLFLVAAVWLFYVWVAFLLVCFVLVIAPYATMEGMSPSLFW